MRIVLDLTLDCGIERAWALLHSPDAMRFAMAPVLEPAPVEDGWPARWPEATPVALTTRMLHVPSGRMTVELHDEVSGDVRIVHDRGGPVSGPLAALSSWRHRMAVSPLPDGRTRFRDRLDVGGVAAPAMWPTLWALWQWRGHRLQVLARRS
jgi:hypothetical protein